MENQPEFEQFVTETILPVMKTNRISFLVYRTMLGTTENYAVIFPFDLATDIANSKSPVLKEFILKARGPNAAEQFQVQLRRYVPKQDETVYKARPKLSTLLNTSYNVTFEDQ